MAFAVICKSCKARFLLNDDLLRRKVAGKVVTVRCRQCHATIEVDAKDVDPTSLPENDHPPPPPAPAAPAAKTLAFKPAPAPPRPKSSTLMGIGSPAKDGAATELVALSPGLLNISPAPPRATLQGFPEPPPPPGSTEELSSGDWEIAETPAIAKARPTAKTLPVAPPRAKADSIPESVDDFIEELPPSLPPPEEEIPSSTGTPSLKALAHHDQPAAKAPSEDFLANMSAAMNGGMLQGGAGNAPTIDVSTLGSAAASDESPQSIDVSDFDVPVSGKQTLPLFALGDAQSAPQPPARPARPSAQRQTPPRATEGSLSPASLDRPEPADSVRERKNVVAPATKSVPPAAAPRRSGLAAPVLIALAAAAGFLIWKRSATPADAVAHAEQPAPRVADKPAPVAVTPAAAEPVVPAAVASVAEPAPTAADDVTFETTPVKPAAIAAVTPHEAPATDAAAPATPKPASTPAEAKPEPAAPIAKEEPKAPTATPAGPTEPAGPFDRAAAAAALTSGAAQASACKKDGDPSGVASVVITFAPSGRVTSANISGPPFAGTPTGGCIAAALRRVHVPPFEGERVTVSKTIVVQ